VLTPPVGAVIPSTTLVTEIVTAAQDQAAFALTIPVAPGNPISHIADFAPLTNANLNLASTGYPQHTFGFFRSHYPIDTTLNANNGTVATYCSPDQPALSPCGSEEGGDMAGVAFQIITDQYYNKYYGSNNFLFS
jgi:hypothetical protein